MLKHLHPPFLFRELPCGPGVTAAEGPQASRFIRTNYPGSQVIASETIRRDRRGQKLPLAAVLIQAQLLLGLRTQILIQAPRLVTNFMAFMVKLNGKCKFLQEVNQPRILRNAATRCGTWPPRRCGRRRLLRRFRSLQVQAENCRGN